MTYNRKDILGLRDKWADADGNEYAGRVFPFESLKPKGTELLTVHLEKLADPADLVRHWNHQAPDGSHAWRDAFLELLSVIQ